MKKVQSLKGFRDFQGKELIIRKQIMKVFEDAFIRYGFEPLETPVLENAEVLLGKYGEEEKLVYKFKDHGGREVAMKYDLTVPTARYLAEHRNEVILPWKRYQMQPVWRADNTQKGRFREFYQLDADTFGSRSQLVEIEFIDLGLEVLQELGFKQIRVRLSNRKILNAIAEYSGMPEKFTDIVYAIDKWDKRTVEETEADLTARLDGNKQAASKVIELINFTGTAVQKLEFLKSKLVGIKEGVDGVSEIQTILKGVKEQKMVEFDPTIARGLAYYTGPVWEFEIIEGGVGSVGGCGRYDKLVESLLGEDIPAAGGSFGIERIIEVMKDRRMMENLAELPKEVLVTVFSEELLVNSIETARLLRDQGFNVIVFPELKKLAKQMEYADKKQIPWVVIIGEDEAKNNQYTLRDMTSAQENRFTFDELVEKLGQKVD